MQALLKSHLVLRMSILPQDGASTFKSDTKEVDLRVSILPTKNNERIVMRILNKEAGEKKLSELGFEAKDLEKI